MVREGREVVRGGRVREGSGKGREVVRGGRGKGRKVVREGRGKRREG